MAKSVSFIKNALQMNVALAVVWPATATHIIVANNICLLKPEDK